MGEWNETCMMTRLPILPGESVIGLLLTRRSTVLDRSYPDGEYTPVSLPVLGDYDGYGSIEIAWATADIIKVANRATLYEQVSNTYHPVSLDADMPAFSMSNLFDIASDNRLFINTDVNGQPTFQRVEPIFIKEDFFRFAVRQYIADFSPYVLRHNPSLLTRLPDALRPESNQPACENLRKYLAFRACLNACRIPIAPVCGKGSQTGVEKRPQLELYKFMFNTAHDIYH